MNRFNERGATLTQFVIVFPLLILFIFGVVDFARFFTLQSILNKGAEDGARTAATMPNLDIDLRGLTTADDDYKQFAEARRRVVTAAESYPESTLVTDIDTPSPSKLIPFYMTDSALSLAVGEQPPILRAGAGLIRPGEQIEFGENQPYSIITHQLFPPGSGGVLPPQNMAMLMKEFPVEVHVRATLNMILPLGTITVTGSSIGWHGRVPRGPFGNIMGSSTTTTTTSTTSSTATTTTTTSTTSTTGGCVINWGQAVTETRGAGMQLGLCPHLGFPGAGGNCANLASACGVEGL